MEKTVEQIAMEEARRQYQREWRRKNPDKVKACQQRYWEKKGREMIEAFTRREGST